MTLEQTKEERHNGKTSMPSNNFLFMGKKLTCRVWSDTGEKSTPKMLAKSTIKFGQPEFVVKIGGKKRFYRVNYETKGLIKQDGKVMLYDTHFSNSVGALAFYEFPEAMDSDQAYTVFRNNAVDMYVKKGGIPFLYLLVAMGLAFACVVAIIATVPAGMQAQEQVKNLDEQVTLLKQQNQNLQTQLANTNSNPNNVLPNQNLGSGFNNE